MEKVQKYLILLLIAAIWGSGFMITQKAINDIGVYAFLSLRFTVATLPLAVFVLSKRFNVFQNWKLGLLIGISHFLIYAPQTIGLQFTTPSNSAFITGLFITFTPIISFLILKKKATIVEIAAAIIATIGLWILTGGIGKTNSGDFITILAALAQAMLIVLTVKAIEEKSNIFVLTFQQLFVTTVLSLVCALFTKSNFITQNVSTYLIIIYLGIFASFFAFMYQAIVLQTLDSTIVAIITSTEPLFALLFSWIFMIEEFSIYKLAGGIIMLFAIILPSTLKYNHPQ